MRHELLSAYAFRHILIEHFPNEFLSIFGNHFPLFMPKLDLISSHLLKYLLIVLATKGWPATHEYIQNDTQ